MSQESIKTSSRLIRAAPDGSRAVTVSADGSLQIWDVKSGSEVHKLTGHEGMVIEAIFVSDSSAVVSASEDRTVRVWDVATGKEVASFLADSPLGGFTVASDPPVIIAGDDFGRTYFLRIEGLDGTTAAKQLAAPVVPHRTLSEIHRVSRRKFDVFLCHNSVDKPLVRQIHERLKSRGIRPWLDEEEIRPGTDWIDILERQISVVLSAAVFVGKHGMGPWQQLEVKTLLRKFVRQGTPIIPVILDNCNRKPNFPSFLEGFQFVDFRDNDSDPFDRLVWGITGKRNEAMGW